MNTAATRFKQVDVVALDVALVALFATLTAVSAQVAIRLPFSPVPITLQVFAVILSGLVLGGRRGFASQIVYLAAGAAGLPVFAHGSGTVLHLVGPTAGYLVAFPAAAWIAGEVHARLARWAVVGAVLAGLASVTMIYAGGLAWLLVWQGLAAVPLHAWGAGVAPFVMVDVAKAVGAALMARFVARTSQARG